MSGRGDRGAEPAAVSGRGDRGAGPAAVNSRGDYRIEDLAHLSGASVRTIRSYQDRGLLPRPERRGRANLYGDAHLVRLRQIGELLGRGYTLASVGELLEAWDAGRGLGGVLGLVAEVDGPWSDEETARISRAELVERFGGASADAADGVDGADAVVGADGVDGTVADEGTVADDGTVADAVDAAVADAVELGVLEPVAGDPDSFLVPSPQELSVAVELYAAGVPLSATACHLRELRGQVEHIASRFVEFTTEHVFARYLDGAHHLTDAETAEATALVRRLRPLAQRTVDAELARAMRLLAVRQLRRRLGAPEGAPDASATRQVALPVGTMRAVEALVGRERAAEFVALAAEREVGARALDDLAASHATPADLDEIP